jgi:hypothetical protein
LEAPCKRWRARALFATLALTFEFALTLQRASAVAVAAEREESHFVISHGALLPMIGATQHAAPRCTQKLFGLQPRRCNCGDVHSRTGR